MSRLRFPNLRLSIVGLLLLLVSVTSAKPRTTLPSHAGDQITTVTKRINLNACTCSLDGLLFAVPDELSDRLIPGSRSFFSGALLCTHMPYLASVVICCDDRAASESESCGIEDRWKEIDLICTQSGSSEGVIPLQEVREWIGEGDIVELDLGQNWDWDGSPDKSGRAVIVREDPVRIIDSTRDFCKLTEVYYPTCNSITP